MSKATHIDVTAALVNYNARKLLPPCMDALRTSVGYLNMRPVVVDNASRDNSADLLRTKCANCYLPVNTQCVGFDRTVNQALAIAKCRYLLLLNTDVFVAPDTLPHKVQYLDANPRCSLVGVRLERRDGLLHPSSNIPTKWNEFPVTAWLAHCFPGVQMVDDTARDRTAVRECDLVQPISRRKMGKRRLTSPWSLGSSAKPA